MGRKRKGKRDIWKGIKEIVIMKKEKETRGREKEKEGGEKIKDLII